MSFGKFSCSISTTIGSIISITGPSLPQEFINYLRHVSIVTRSSEYKNVLTCDFSCVSLILMKQKVSEVL